MRTSLLVRLLAVSLTIAVVAIVATAWLASRTTTDRLVGEFGRSLEADGFVYGQLAEHAANHQDWDAIGPLVDELAQRTGKRIALTTEDGEPIADSAGPDPLPLPGTPAALLDPLAPLLTVHGAEARPGVLADLPPAMALPRDDERRDVVIWAATRGACAIDLAAWEDEQAGQAVSRLTHPADAVGASGLFFLPATATGDPDTDRWLEDSLAAQRAGSRPPPSPPIGPFDDPDGPPEEQPAVFLVDGCEDLDLPLPGPETQRLHRQLRVEVAACLDAADVPHGWEIAHRTAPPPVEGVIAGEPDGDERAVMLYRRVLALPDDEAQTSAATTCAEDTHRRLLAGYLAEPALLYLGTDEVDGVFAAAGRERLLAAVAAVLVVTLGATVIAGRRLLRPVRALTIAAERLAAGDRGARAEVRGRDELGRLGAAFNTMAGNLEQTDRQRRALVSDVAHELRSPITTLRGYLEGASDGVVEVDDDLLRALHGDTVLLQRLVDDLQQLTLADAGALDLHLEPVDVGDVVRQVAASQGATADAAGIELEVDTDGGVLVEADAGRLRQVVGNLVANALRYTPGGGRVSVVCRHAGDEVTIEVADTGVGIDAEHLPHVFDRFYRVDDSRSRETGGTGIGLAIVRAIVDAHGGEVEATSQPGQGTTFTVRLPGSRGRADPSRRTS